MWRLWRVAEAGQLRPHSRCGAGGSVAAWSPVAAHKVSLVTLVTMTDTSGGEGDEDEDFSSDFEQSFCNETTDHLYLFIETLTGTSFEMKVSPFETIVSIKAKLQQLEGIPVSQQHLLYNNSELPSQSSLYECEVPDGATLKLVLSMRGGPINTRRDPGHQLQQAVEQSREELLEHIPEGGHVTVLVFRDGDQINLYHVLERPDGSYSPLSDSWSGSSIRNLFAENEDPEIQERLQENANTMSKMQDIRCRIDEKKSKRLSKTSESIRTRSKRTHLSILPPLKTSEENEGDLKNLTSVSEIQKSSNHFQTNRLLNRREPLPRVKDVKTSVDLPDTASSTACKALSARGRAPPQPQRYEHCSLPARLQGGRRWISADVGELKKTVDSQDSVSPVLFSSVRSEKSEFKKKAEKLTQGFATRRPRLYSPPSSDTNMSRGKSLKNLDEPTSNENIQSPNICDSVAPFENRRVPSLHLENEKSTNMAESLMSQHKQEADKQMSSLHQEPQSLERRLASRGRVKALASPLRRTVLASPKLNSPRSGRGSAGKLRPSYQTRPLSGPKHRGGGGGGRARCGGADCRKKLTITNTFVCRCSASFCPLHRHPESHACTFDYKAEGRRLLKAANPLVSLPKLPKI